jgi:hypothetical protein
MFWILRFILFWLIFILLADKQRWRELFTVGFFSIAIGASTDNLMHHFHMWIYDNQQTELIADLTDDWGVYIVTTYLFIQWLPKAKNFRNMIIYWLIWTTITIIIEFIHVYTGHMSYPSWWNIWWSYPCDWILFYVFYKFHQIFKLQKLSPE